MITKQIEDKALEVGKSYWFRYGDIIDKITLIDRKLVGKNSCYLVKYNQSENWLRTDKIKMVQFSTFLPIYKYQDNNSKADFKQYENILIKQQKSIEKQIELLEKRVISLDKRILKNRQNKKETVKKESVKKGYSTYPEFLCYTILSYAEDMKLIESFKPQVAFDFAINKRYDFLINDNIILETHGLQHYELPNTSVFKSLEETKENDKIKRNLAEQNGFIYFEIDCRYSEFDYCYDNIIEALSNVIDTSRLSKEKIGELCKTPFHEKVLKLWNDGLSTYEIADKLNVSTNKIAYELKRLNEMSLIEYNFDIANKRGVDRRMEKEKSKEEPLVLIEIKSGNVKRFKNKYELSKELKIDIHSLYSHMSGRNKTLRNQFIIKKEDEFDEDKVNEYICETGTLKWTYFLKKDGKEYVYFDVNEVFSAKFKSDEIRKLFKNTDVINYQGFEIRRKKLNQKKFKPNKNQIIGDRTVTKVNDTNIIYVAIDPETGEEVGKYTQKEIIEKGWTPASVRNACPLKDDTVPLNKYGDRRKYKGYFWKKVIKN